MRSISIANRLEVIGPDSVMVPGCEPTSAVTSDTLNRFWRCRCALVPLAEALAAIPGSWVEWQINNGQSNGSRKKWFVLPPYYVDCPCVPMPDYYAILRSLPCDQTEEEPPEACSALYQGWCPPKDIESQLPPPVRTYVQEGNIFGVTPSLLYGPYYFGGNNPGAADDVPLVM